MSSRETNRLGGSRESSLFLGKSGCPVQKLLEIQFSIVVAVHPGDASPRDFFSLLIMLEIVFNLFYRVLNGIVENSFLAGLKDSLMCIQPRFIAKQHHSMRGD